MPEGKTFAELYEEAPEIQKKQIRTEVRSALVEVGLLMSRVHDVTGQLKVAFANSSLLNDLTRETLEYPQRVLERYAQGAKGGSSELSESPAVIEVGQHVKIDSLKGGKYADETGRVLHIVNDVAMIRMDNLAIDLEQPVSLLQSYDPENDD